MELNNIFCFTSTLFNINTSSTHKESQIYPNRMRKSWKKQKLYHIMWEYDKCSSSWRPIKSVQFHFIITVIAHQLLFNVVFSFENEDKTRKQQIQRNKQFFSLKIVEFVFMIWNTIINIMVTLYAYIFMTNYCFYFSEGYSQWNKIYFYYIIAFYILWTFFFAV